ncbi:hypothetical protein GCM10010965_18950 [Caldalkalibacillus thermarum]|uniref:hypothetical protein n=1 Tax=Caldalkalibacillus thermarum TaxID=296745 RepID=UPI0016676D25|nr:hypothetical protein [Caldalkalibacillus thermarum]GGK26469.1 hypothetical protein GCM10010965_18950 [Caldalkalibacillus thermarum]
MKKKFFYKMTLLLSCFALIFSTVTPYYANAVVEEDEANCACCEANAYANTNEVGGEQPTQSERNKVLAAINSSEQFRSTNSEIRANDGAIDRSQTEVIKVDEDKFIANFKVEDAENGLSILTYFVEMDNRMNHSIALEQKQYYVAVSDNEVEFTWVMNDETFLNVIINDSGNIVYDGVEYEVNEYIELKLSELEGEVGTQSLCAWAVGVLCGTGGGAACYGVCAVKAIVNFLGGLGCATACCERQVQLNNFR